MGDPVGLAEGLWVGAFVALEGLDDGDDDGISVCIDGDVVGNTIGFDDGDDDGISVSIEGEVVGDTEGDREGEVVGGTVGISTSSSSLASSLIHTRCVSWQ